jgi:hypothetical protein
MRKKGYRYPKWILKNKGRVGIGPYLWVNKKPIFLEESWIWDFCL